jgi:[acyl-carrier-protein] S-malonyltransferase
MAAYALLFPGQASQFVGMGQDLEAGYPAARETFAQADQALGFSLSRLCFAGPEEQLRQTAFTQPAVFVHSVAAWRVLAAEGVEPVCAAGHSLGEYAALVAAGALDFGAGLELVRQRGQLMQRAGEERPGRMVAVMGLDDERVSELCRQAAAVGAVVPANFNAPGQVVVSGESAAVECLGELARAAGAGRVVELAVSGAFHSPLMEPAARRMEALLRAAPIRAPRVPVITNVAARPVREPEELRQCLIEQMTCPVRWTESVRELGPMGATIAVEVGPGAVLKGLARRIEPRLEVLNAGRADELETAVRRIRELG